MSQTMPIPPIAVLVLALIVMGLLCGLMAFVLLRLVMQSRGGGWGRLAPQFATDARPTDGYRFAHHRTIQVGAVVAKRCTTIGVGPRGLYLEVPWRQAVLIPWSEVRVTGSTSLHWRQAATLAAGAPPGARLTVFPEDLEAMKPFLRRSAEAPAAPNPEAVGTT